MLLSQRLRDIDATTARPRLPARALPDDVRMKLKLPPRDAENMPRKTELIVAGPRVPKAASKSTARNGKQSLGGMAGRRKESFGQSAYASEYNSMQRI